MTVKKNNISAQIVTHSARKITKVFLQCQKISAFRRDHMEKTNDFFPDIIMVTQALFEREMIESNIARESEKLTRKELQKKYEKYY